MSAALAATRPAPADAAAAVLEVADLTTRFATPEGDVVAADAISFAIPPGASLGVVGESGSGKTQVFLSIMGLLAGNGRSTGSVRYRGQEILNLPPRRLNAVRGAKISMIFQDPMTSLNPVYSDRPTARRSGAGRARTRQGTRRWPANAVSEMLDLVGIPDAGRRDRASAYPHEFSGGMRQRVMIAMSLIMQQSRHASSPTSRPRHSTSPCRRRSWSSCADSRPSSAWPWRWSPTIWG